MVNNPNKSDRFPFSTPKELTKEVEAYQAVKDFKTRNGALRFLIRKGLESEYEKSKELKVAVQKILEHSLED